MNDTVHIHVISNIYTDDVWVSIPTKYWGHPCLSEGIKKSIDINFCTEWDQPPDPCTVGGI